MAATGLENHTITCDPPLSEIIAGSVLQWFIAKTTIEAATMIDLSKSDKYNISGSRSQHLTVKNINSSDEGFYFCRTSRDGMLQPVDNRIAGACLYAFSKSK